MVELELYTFHPEGVWLQMKRVLESSLRGPCTPENDTAFSVIVFDVSWGNLVSGQTRSIAGVKLFCCLFAMMDKAPCSVFAACLVFFEATLDTLVYFMADVPAVFSVASHRWLCLSTVAPSAPLLSAQWYTHKKTIFCEHDIACTVLCQCVFSITNALQDVPEHSHGF